MTSRTHMDRCREQVLDMLAQKNMTVKEMVAVSAEFKRRTFYSACENLRNAGEIERTFCGNMNRPIYRLAKKHYAEKANCSQTI